MGENASFDLGEDRCLACGAPLAIRPGSHPLAFVCAKGHSLTLQELLDGSLLRGETEPRDAFERWPRKVRLLHGLADQALRLGHPLPAADLQEAAARIDGWISHLRVLLFKDAVAPRFRSAGRVG